MVTRAGKKIGPGLQSFNGAIKCDVDASIGLSVGRQRQAVAQKVKETKEAKVENAAEVGATRQDLSWLRHAERGEKLKGNRGEHTAKWERTIERHYLKMGLHPV
jgi:hypothetical protein